MYLCLAVSSESSAASASLLASLARGGEREEWGCGDEGKERGYATATAVADDDDDDDADDAATADNGMDSK